MNQQTGTYNNAVAGQVTTCQNGNPDCKFVRVHIPVGYDAQIHAFVPLEQGCQISTTSGQPTYNQQTGQYEQHEQMAHGASDMPNAIDPNGGWVDARKCVTKS